jgi:alginate O-acetyltransferase complex protein AlgF
MRKARASRTFACVSTRGTLTALTLVCALASGTAFAAPQLYDTGPSADAALVRFVNATRQAITVVSDDAGHPRLTIPAAPASFSASATSSPAAAEAITDYRGARSSAPITGEWQQGTARARVTVTAKAGGTTSIVAWRKPDGALTSTSFQEDSSFDGLHASLALYVADSGCQHAGLLALPQRVAVFEDRPAASMSRRGLNAVKLSVQAVCDGRPSGPPLDLGQLQIGVRYSVFLVPGDAGSQLLGTRDRIAH